MPRAGFEPTIPVFERLKTIHALHRAVIGTCQTFNNLLIISLVSSRRLPGCDAVYCGSSQVHAASIFKVKMDL
jgi:hypothetical protein